MREWCGMTDKTREDNRTSIGPDSMVNAGSANIHCKDKGNRIIRVKQNSAVETPEIAIKIKTVRDIISKAIVRKSLRRKQ